MSSETFILLMSDDWSRFPDLGSGFREVHRRGSFISHKHADRKIADVIREFVYQQTNREVSVSLAN